jgi:hypothetical protein
MENDRRLEEILLKEYAEAGQICRWYEQLTRTSLSILLPFSTALIGYLLGSSAQASTKLGLSTAGLVISLLFVNTVRRQQLYYRSYITRAKEIEGLIITDGTPIMKLYTQGANATSGSKTIRNKTAIALVIWLAVLYFLVSVVLYGYQVACQARL